MTGLRIEMRGELHVDYIPQSGSVVMVRGEDNMWNLIQILNMYNGQQVKITIERVKG